MRALTLVVATAVVTLILWSSKPNVVTASAQGHLRPKSDIDPTFQLHDLAEDQPIDQVCGMDGDPPATKKASRLQNDQKNNFFLSGTPVTVTRGVLRMLEKRAEQLGVPHGGDSALPGDRAILRDIFTDRGVPLGEGTLVQLSTRLIDAHYSNVSNGESVNCHETGQDNNDIHVVLSQNEDDDECESVTAEISPHFRPERWTAIVGLDLQNRPLRFTGPLFFDASHSPCKPNKAASPKRSSLWEIHPVYGIDVCKSVQLNRCKASDASMWQSLDSWVGNQDR